MSPHYKDWDYKGSDRVAQIATKLYAARQKPCRLSPLVMMSDPNRIQDIIKATKALPRDATLIYRHFGKAGHVEEARTLRQITFERGQQFLIGNDPELAIEIGADGVHFRRDADVAAPALWRQRCPGWLITMAGVKDGAPYRGNLAVLDAVFVSSVFDSQSPSAGPAMGVSKFQQICSNIFIPVFALGGINTHTASALTGSGAAGIAGVGSIIQG